MNKNLLFYPLISVCLLLCSCSNTGGYFQNDGPPSSIWGQKDYSLAPDAVPRVEEPHKFANRPYTINGVRYKPIIGDAEMTQIGIGSWYGKQFHGNKTSIGETYNMYAMTAAHTTMQLPSYAKVTNLENGKSVIVRVNDRGPFLQNRVIDLSYAAASKLGYVKKGTAKVRVERIRNIDIQNGRINAPTHIRMNETLLPKEQDEADRIALASIIGDIEPSASKSLEPIEPIEALSKEKEVQIINDLHTDRMDSTTNAVDLTEIAKQGDMVSTDVVVSKPTVNSETLSDNQSTWRIQAGIFSTYANAQSRVEQIKQHISDQIDIVEDNGRFRVLIGHFTDLESVRDQAQTFGTLLNEKLIPFEIKK